MRTSEDPVKPGYEVRDVNARGVTLLALGLAIAVGVALLLMLALFGWLAARSSQGERPLVSLAGPADALPPEPRLQSDPARDLATMRAQEQALLDGYAWVDRDAGIASMPIREAMKLVVARGLPAREVPGAASTEAPRSDEAPVAGDAGPAGEKP